MFSLILVLEPCTYSYIEDSDSIICCDNFLKSNIICMYNIYINNIVYLLCKILVVDIYAQFTFAQ